MYFGWRVRLGGRFPLLDTNQGIVIISIHENSLVSEIRKYPSRNGSGGVSDIPYLPLKHLFSDSLY